MTFTASQVRKLRSKLKPQHVRTREAEGLSLSYLEGWHVLAEANRIFGFDGWDRETISSDCVWTKQVAGRYCAAYVTRVRIRVRAGEAVIVREGSGAGESNAATPGQAHEFAAKAAETDATKRALMTFGNAFGLSLYGGTLEPRGKAPSSEGPPPAREVAPVKVVAGEAQPLPQKMPTAVLVADPKPVTLPEVNPSPSGEAPPAAAETVPAELASATEAKEAVTDTPAWPEIKPLEEAERLSQERSQRIDKAELTLSEPRRIRDLGHLAFVASKPCLICGRNRAHAHHLKFAQPTALGRKVSDEFTVPLCSNHHRELHQHGDERAWWAAHGIDALKVAEELWASRRRSIESAMRA
ncbi:Rad52/Rad22 family DNA repair protein [Aestuariivirga sp.]|uniref:Rad52/Rad22 family DNA repair protein n=1 Tax=Aestuariivirga sp. TaxID=2650926 RepID=UPI00391C253B